MIYRNINKIYCYEYTVYTVQYVFLLQLPPPPPPSLFIIIIIIITKIIQMCIQNVETLLVPPLEFSDYVFYIHFILKHPFSARRRRRVVKTVFALKARIRMRQNYIFIYVQSYTEQQQQQYYIQKKNSIHSYFFLGFFFQCYTFASSYEILFNTFLYYERPKRSFMRRES